MDGLIRRIGQTGEKREERRDFLRFFCGVLFLLECFTSTNIFMTYYIIYYAESIIISYCIINTTTNM